MKKYIALVFGALFTVSANAQTPEDYKLEVKDFDQLKVTDGINVDYYCSDDSAGMAYFTCVPAMAPKLMFSNNKNCLHIQVASGDEILTDLPTIRVYSTSLQKVENASDSTVRVVKAAPVPVFKSKVIGNGTLIITDIEANTVEASIQTGKGHIVISKGKAQKVKLSNVGTGPIEAGGLQGKEVKATLFGTGDVDCTATQKLLIYGAGSGKVYYNGNPEQVSNRSLGVKAFPVGK